MSQTEILIGTVIEVNKAEIKRETDAWEKSLFPYLREVADFFNSMEAGPFDDNILKLLLSNSVKEIEGIVFNCNKKGVKNSVLIDVVKQYTKEKIDQLLQKWTSLLREFERLSTGSIAGVGLTWQNVSVVDGEPYLNKEAIEKKHTISIETDKQLELYKLLKGVKEAYNELSNFCSEHGSLLDIIRTDNSSTSMLSIDSNEYMFINLECIKEF